MFRGTNGGTHIVQDLEVGKKFYIDNFGCEVTRQDPVGSGKAMDELIGIEGVQIVQCWLAQPGNDRFSLHLIEFVHPKRQARTELHTAGTQMIGFSSDDLEGDCAKLVANGGRLAGKIVDFGNGRKLAWGLDPDGVIMRLIQET